MAGKATSVAIATCLLVLSCLSSSAAALNVTARLYDTLSTSSRSLQCDQVDDKLTTCTDSTTILRGQNITYRVEYAYPADWDAVITLDSLNGDADLSVTTSDGDSFTSQLNIGTEHVMLYRYDLEKLKSKEKYFIITVMGFAPTTTFTLTLDQDEEWRQLSDAAAQAVGTIIDSCCSTPYSCPDLKAYYPTLNDKDTTTNPNYCYLRPNFCTRARYEDDVMQSALLWLSLDNLYLNCKFPTELIATQLRNLTRISMAYNQISGTIEDIAEGLKALPLESFSMNTNNLEGDLSSACAFGSPLMTSITIEDNKIQGELPACLTKAPLLRQLHVSQNLLGGDMPAIPAGSVLNSFHAARMKQYWRLSGSAPEIGGLKEMYSMDLSGNKLEGSLPSLPSTMLEIRLADNKLSGEIPKSYYDSASPLRVVDISTNMVNGAFPAQFAAMSNLTFLSVGYNNITGQLPSDWSALQSLRVLSVEDNQLSGNFSTSLSKLTSKSLVYLGVGGNKLSGSLQDYASAVGSSNAGNGYMRFYSVGNSSLSGDPNDLSGLAELAIFSSDDENWDPALLTVHNSQIDRTFDISNNDLSGLFPRWLLEALTVSTVKIKVLSNGNKFLCPSKSFVIDKAIPEGRLEGLTCYRAGSVDEITATTKLEKISNYVRSDPHPGLSVMDKAGIAAGTIVGFLVAVVGAIWIWNYSKARRAMAKKAAADADKGRKGLPSQASTGKPAGQIAMTARV